MMAESDERPIQRHGHRHRHDHKRREKTTEFMDGIVDIRTSNKKLIRLKTARLYFSKFFFGKWPIVDCVRYIYVYRYIEK